jgi:hypothetical protein
VTATMHIACGGGAAVSSNNTAAIKAGTPPGNYTVTIQGSSGTVTHTATLNFVVN